MGDSLPSKLSVDSSKVAARLIIFIGADNPSIGLVGFVAVGMTEASSCEATVHESEKVKRGDELGTFHFGGSDIVINKSTPIDFSTTPRTFTILNKTICIVNAPSS